MAYRLFQVLYSCISPVLVITWGVLVIFLGFPLELLITLICYIRTGKMTEYNTLYTFEKYVGVIEKHSLIKLFDIIP